MPYADNQGVRIHYQIEGLGHPLVLQHGFTESIEDWYECGYVDALRRDYRLILVDARGHGKSDKPMIRLIIHRKPGSAMSSRFWMLLVSKRRTFGVIRWGDGSGSAWLNLHPTVLTASWSVANTLLRAAWGIFVKWSAPVSTVAPTHFSPPFGRCSGQRKVLLQPGFGAPISGPISLFRRTASAWMNCWR